MKENLTDPNESGENFEAEYGKDPRRWRALITLLAAGFLTLLAVSILNVSVPSLTKSLQMGPNHVQWIMSGYSLTFGLALIPSGRLGDSFGRRRLFLIGVGLFTMVCILAGCAQNATMLVSMRLMEGIAAAIISPQVIGLIQQLFRGAERAFAFAYFGMSIGISTAIGPPLGGLFLALLGTDYGWRASFLVNVPVCLVVLVLAVKLLPAEDSTNSSDSTSAGENAKSKPRLSLDLPGTFLLGLAVIAVMWPFISSSQGHKHLSQAPWWLLVVAFILLGLFWWWESTQEKRGRDVIFPRSLARDRSYLVGTILISVFVSGWQAMFIIYTLFLQLGLGLEPVWAGAMQIPIAVASAIISPLSASLVVRWGRWVLVLASGLAAVALAGSVAVGLLAPAHLIPWLLIAVMFLVGLGAGLFNSPAQSLAMVTVPVETGGTAGGVSQTAQRVAGAIVMAFVTLIFYLRVDVVAAQVAASGAEAPAASSALTPGSTAAQAVYSDAYAWSAGAIVLVMGTAMILALADSLKRPGNPLAKPV